MILTNEIMKKSFFTLLILLIGFIAYSQSYSTSIGFKIGDKQYGVFRINWKTFIKEKNAVEISVGMEQNYGGFFVEGIYQYHRPLIKALNLDWYAGLGPNWGVGNYVYARSMFGLEHVMTIIPLTIAVEYGPNLFILKGDRPPDQPEIKRIGLGFGIGIRYVFRSDYSNH